MSLKRKWSDEDKKNIRNLLESGKTYKEVGVIYNFTPGKLRNIMIFEWGWKDFCCKLDCKLTLDKRLKRYSSRYLRHTRNFLIENLLNSKEFQVEKGFMLKADFIEQYYESRKISGEPVYDYDFSLLPDYITSRRQLVEIIVPGVSTKTGKPIENWFTCYKNFVTLGEDNRVVAGMFSKRKTSQYIDTEEFIKRSKEKFGDEIYGYDKVNYVNLKTTIELRCNICGDYYWQMPNEHMYSVGAGCPVCAMKHSGEVRLLETGEAIRRIIEVYGENYWDFSKFHYTGSQKKIIVIDPLTKEEFEVSYESLLLRDPHFHKRSLGEDRISLWLCRNDINYIPQYKIRSKTFSNKRFISVDFYLNDLNMIIEFNGIQHYNFSKTGFFNRNRQDFIKQVKRDKELVEYCKSHKISYLEIPYTYMDSVDSILEKVVLENVDPLTIIEYPSVEEVKL